MTETRANGQVAFGHYMWDDSAAAFLPHSIDVLDLRGDRIAAATAYFRADLGTAPRSDPRGGRRRPRCPARPHRAIKCGVGGVE
jgi:hypothetical protein